MAKHLGDKLTEGSMRLLGAATSERENCVILLLTVDDEGGGGPRVCLLSPYQVVATNPSDLYFEVYPGSHTEQNLDRSEAATLVLPESIGLLYVHGRATKLNESSGRLQKPNSLLNKLPQGALYRMSISRVESDVSQDAPITSRMAFDTSVIGAEYRRTFERMKDRIMRS